MRKNQMRMGALSTWFAVTFVLFSLGGCSKPDAAPEETAAVDATPEPGSEHRGYDSPEAAVEALAVALAANDVDTSKLIFGPGGDPLLEWGDPVAERQDREKFTEMYEAKHGLVDGPDGEKTLEIGVKDWPLPAPLVQREGRWYFDGAAGAEELVYRRVGRNELGAIAVAHGYVNAQYEYASKPRDGNMAGLFAAFLISDPGRQNGLFWPAEEGQPMSPVGPFIASAAGEGYRRAARGEPVPYHGYFYRMLYAQGPDAEGGEKDYFVSGRLVNGFAMIAWPAAYGVSGVKTFIVNQDGVVYETDFGEETPSRVNEIRAFNPGSQWAPVAAELPVD